MKVKNLIQFTILLLTCVIFYGCFSEYAFRIRVGSRSYHEGNYPKAIESFTKAIQLKPSRTAGYYNRGQVQYKKGKYNLAINDYTKVIEIDPNCIEAYTNRGSAFIELKKFNRAISDFNKAIEINPELDFLFLERGRARLEIGNTEIALKDLNRAITLNPKNEFAYLNRGDIWYQKCDLKKAISDLSTTLEINSENIGALNSLAWILATSHINEYRNGEKAVSLAQKAIFLAQKAVKIKRVAQTVDTLAAAYAESGKFTKAIEAQEKAIAAALLIESNYAEEILPGMKERLEFYKQKKSWGDRCNGKNI